MTTTGGGPYWTCWLCGSQVPNGCTHHCPTFSVTNTYPHGNIHFFGTQVIPLQTSNPFGTAALGEDKT
ncbi:MAG: hypothetical protein OEV62_03285 [Actinomycetota bacterium]|nr:hypothetical protein [Actinomycetota bacterium]